MDRAGVLQKSEHPTVHPPLSERAAAGSFTNSVRNYGLIRQPKVGPTPTEPSSKRDNERAEVQPRQNRALSRYEQIATTMRLAGAVYEVNKMFDDEIQKGPPQLDDNFTPSDAVGASITSMSNPVFETLKAGEIDIEAVHEAMIRLKARLDGSEEKAGILSSVCKRWKAEVQKRYPPPTRKVLPPSDIETASPHEDVSTENYTVVSGKPQIRNSEYSHSVAYQNKNDGRGDGERPQYQAKIRKGGDDEFSIFAL
ncbi:hypothetical protein E4T47_00924 [Aureobasidium subglaciale]|nr:hypothetical protein E4T47_00924 [Aureobasidium subglaciale]